MAILESLEHLEDNKVEENLSVADSLNELQNNVTEILNSIKSKETDPPLKKKKRVTIAQVYEAVQNITEILRLNGFAVPDNNIILSEE